MQGLHEDLRVLRFFAPGGPIVIGLGSTIRISDLSIDLLGSYAAGGIRRTFYHVIIRSNQRKEIFCDDRDRIWRSRDGDPSIDKPPRTMRRFETSRQKCKLHKSSTNNSQLGPDSTPKTACQRKPTARLALTSTERRHNGILRARPDRSPAARPVQ